jgi:hypothetical protein
MAPPKLPSFSGDESSAISFYDFTLTVRRILKNIKMYSGSAVEWLLRGLTGVARREVTMFLEENSQKSVTDILAFLDQRFNPDTNIDFLLRDFYSREQQESESIMDYSLDLQLLYKRILQKDSTAITDRSLRNHFVYHLRDSNLKLQLLPYVRTADKTFNEVKNLTLDRYNELKQICSVTSPAQIAAVQSTSTPTEVVCFWCQGVGHIERNCQAKRLYLQRRQQRSGNVLHRT